MRTAMWIALGAILAISGCGLLDGATSPEDIQHRSVVQLEPSEMADGMVRIDSLSWLPALVAPGFDVDPEEVDGVFAARFENLSGHPLQVRYQLRFYDPDGFLLDTFFPFHQPLKLAAHEIRWVRAEFRLELTTAAAEWLASMHLVANIQVSDS